MLGDDKLPSNFSGQYEPIAVPFDDELQQYGSEDIIGMYDQQIPIEPPDKPKDYRAMSEAKLYEMLTQNGAVRSIDVELNMIDDTDGSGKATVVIGKDAKRRTFEIPISVKDGNVTIDKAIDLDSDKVLDIDDGTAVLFEAPNQEILYKRLQKTYDKHKDFFQGKVTDKKVETLVKRYPSLSDDEARQFLQDQYMEHRGAVYNAMKTAKDHRRAIIIGVGITGVALLLLIQGMRKRGTEAAHNGYGV